MYSMQRKVLASNSNAENYLYLKVKTLLRSTEKATSHSM